MKEGIEDVDQKDKVDLLDQAGRIRVVLWIALVMTLQRNPDYGGCHPEANVVQWIGQQMCLDRETVRWLACDRWLGSEACTCIESIEKLCRERGVWGGSMKPPTESVTMPPGGTSPSGVWTPS